MKPKSKHTTLKMNPELTDVFVGRDGAGVATHPAFGFSVSLPVSGTL